VATPQFSIITPSFNGLSYLKRCCASVADQADATAEQLVVDGASTDGTRDWLPRQGGLRWVSEPDRGMYDAVNKGLLMARGEIVAYLNCDEQYLPGTLQAVRQCFESHPDCDLVYGNMLVIQPDGSLAAFRKSYPLRWWSVLAGHLYVPTCALFWRRRLVDQGFAFDPSYRGSGDADFVVRVLQAGHRTFHLRRYLAAFTVTGQNLSAGAGAAAENERLIQRAPAWIRLFRHPLNWIRLSEKALHGAYFESFPLTYALHTEDAPSRRTEFTSHKASCRWPSAGQRK
jgi:glycosyltransferase involved in cell wall biosynthesis